MADLVVVHRVDRRPAGFSSPLPKLVCLALACEKGVFVLPDRDRESLATLLVEQEIGVRETVALFEIGWNVSESLDQTVGIVGLVRADTRLHRDLLRWLPTFPR